MPIFFGQIKDMTIDEILKLGSETFCLTHSDLGPSSRKEHNYFAQVQGEIAIKGLSWCNFVVWTASKKNNIFIERIHFDKEYVLMVMPKLVEFYTSFVVPNWFQICTIIK